MGVKKILIVEDEVIESQSLEITLTRKGYDCKAVATGEEAIELLQSYDPDIVLMDIGLKGKIDGISTAGIMRQQYLKPIIFITEQDNDAVFQQVRGTLPQNFINKPYLDAVLLQAVEMALDQPPLPGMIDQVTPLGERVSDGVFVYSGNQYKKVLFRDILYLQADGMFTIMGCTMNKFYKISLSSNNVVAQLAYPGIIRTSRSHYVNIHRIDSIRNDELMLEAKSVPMSKNYKADVLARVKKISQKQ